MTKKLTRMVYDVTFNEDVTHGMGVITPGGYTIKTTAGEEVSFDFHYNDIYLNGKTMHVEHEGLDLDYSGKITYEDINGALFTDFYIWLGEEPGDLRPLELTGLTFEFVSDNGRYSEYDATLKMLRSANDSFASLRGND